MTFQEMGQKVRQIEKDDDAWMSHYEVLIDLNGVVVEIADLQFDKEKCAFYIVASRR